MVIEAFLNKLDNCLKKTEYIKKTNNSPLSLGGSVAKHDINCLSVYWADSQHDISNIRLKSRSMC